MFFCFLQWYTRSWRAIMFSANIWPLLAVPLYLWRVKESPRWLIQHGRVDEAAAIIEHIARVNGADPPDWDALELVRYRTPYSNPGVAEAHGLPQEEVQLLAYLSHAAPHTATRRHVLQLVCSIVHHTVTLP